MLKLRKWFWKKFKGEKDETPLTDFDNWTLGCGEFSSSFFVEVGFAKNIKTKVLRRTLGAADTTAWVRGDGEWEVNPVEALIERCENREFIPKDKVELGKAFSLLLSDWDGKAILSSQKNFLDTARCDMEVFNLCVDGMSDTACKNAYDELKLVIPSPMAYTSGRDTTEMTEAEREFVKRLIRLYSTSLGFQGARRSRGL